MGRGPVTAALERRVAAEVRRRAPDLVDLLATLVGFDTRVPGPDLAPREEAALQAHLAGRLEAAGLAVEVWEPDVADLPPTRYPIPPGHHFRGRPQLVARRAGTGGGRSLLFNGHIDVVSAEPVERWTTDPFRADVRDGRLYGRGACDMKGGVAAMVARDRGAVRPRRPAARRSARQHGDRRGVDGRGLAGVRRARRRRRRRDRPRADRAHGVARDARVAHARDHRPRPRRPRGLPARALDGGRPGQRDREGAGRPRRAPGAARGVARPAGRAPRLPAPGDDRPRGLRRGPVDRLLSRGRDPALPRAVPARAGRRRRVVRAGGRGDRGARAGRRRGRPVARRPPAGVRLGRRRPGGVGRAGRPDRGDDARRDGGSGARARDRGPHDVDRRGDLHPRRHARDLLRPGRASRRPTPSTSTSGSTS